MNVGLRADLHVHTREAEPFIPYDAREAIVRAARAGFRVLSITNHDTLTFDAELAACALSALGAQEDIDFAELTPEALGRIYEGTLGTAIELAVESSVVISQRKRAGAAPTEVVVALRGLLRLAGPARVEKLVALGVSLEARARREVSGANGADALVILARIRAAELELHGVEAAVDQRAGVADQLLHARCQPAAVGAVSAHLVLGAAGEGERESQRGQRNENEWTSGHGRLQSLSLSTAAPRS